VTTGTVSKWRRTWSKDNRQRRTDRCKTTWTHSVRCSRTGSNVTSGTCYSPPRTSVRWRSLCVPPSGPPFRPSLNCRTGPHVQPALVTWSTNSPWILPMHSHSRFRLRRVYSSGRREIVSTWASCCVPFWSGTVKTPIACKDKLRNMSPPKTQH